MANGNGEYDYGIGLEGGVVETPHGLFYAIGERSWIGREKSALAAVTAYSCRTPSLNRCKLAFSPITRITRQSMFQDVVICALARFLNPDLYRKDRE